MNSMVRNIDAWKSLTVLVIGEAILDSYLYGYTDRLCREAPAPIVTIQHHSDVPGGAANTAANLAGLGATVVFLSVIGTDREGDRLQFELERRGISIAHLIRSSDRATLAKQRVVAGSQILVRLDQGTIAALSFDLEQRIIHFLIEHYPQVNAVVISDYNYGIMTPKVIEALAELRSVHPQTVVVDSRQLQRYQRVKPTVVKPNYIEAIELLNLSKQSDHRADQISLHAERLLELTGAAIAAVTLDQEGAIVFEHGQPPYRTSAHPVPDNQTSGAGDTFVSAMTLALASGATVKTAASLAAVAAAIVIREPGTTVCTTALLQRFLAKHEEDHKLITDQSDLAACVQHHRQSGQRIVLTNGCFDILHPGHVKYLTQARLLGDVLMVGVNSDESVRQLKGNDRPVNALGDRLTVLSALSCIDYLIPFEELTPHRLIQVICPDVYTKGGDYTRETLPETELVEALGGVVEILPYVENCSTTRLIDQIRGHCLIEGCF